jgi:hypothetical protein
MDFYLSVLTSYTTFSDKYFEGHKFTTTALLYEYMDQYHNGIPINEHFMYLYLASILA